MSVSVGLNTVGETTEPTSIVELRVGGATQPMAPTLFGPFRVEQSALDFASSLGPEAHVVELRQPTLEMSHLTDRTR